MDLLRDYSDRIRNFPTNRNQQTDLLRNYSDKIHAGQPEVELIPPPPGLDVNSEINENLASFGRKFLDYLNFIGSGKTARLPLAFGVPPSLRPRSPGDFMPQIYDQRSSGSIIDTGVTPTPPPPPIPYRPNWTFNPLQG